MKLKLPHKVYDLDASLDIEDKLKLINKILDEIFILDDREMTVDEYFKETWNVQSHKDTTLIQKEIISYYLTKDGRDLSVMSRDKMKEMSRGSKRHTTFSNMGYDNQIAVGLIDIDEY